MIEPILIQTETLLLHSFRAQEMHRFKSLTIEIFQLFSQIQTTKFLPNKKLDELEQAENLLHAALLDQQAGLSQLYFITQKSDQHTIGIIELISPTKAKKHYKLDSYPYILEFCLGAKHTRLGIMGELLPRLVNKLKCNHIKTIAAVAHPLNIPAIKVLNKAGLSQRTHFDGISHVYHL